MPDGINYDAFSEALNDKADRDLQNVDTTAKADAVIDFQLPTAENNYTWYRKYKSGWVEQGGITAKNISSVDALLPIEMANTNYHVNITIETGGTGGGGCDKAHAVGVRSTTYIHIDMVASANYQTLWEVKGMAAQ